MPTPNPIDNYISTQPLEHRETLWQLRKLILETATGATESISYGMPGYKYCGKPLVYFALFSQHIGFYPTPSGISAFADELRAYKTSKGAIQFPLDNPIPFDIIKKITEFRMEENRKKVWSKKKK
jgi:uncharacterized protein YdhG (YjbR/CyaY superfamily)